MQQASLKPNELGQNLTELTWVRPLITARIVFLGEDQSPFTLYSLSPNRKLDGQKVLYLLVKSTSGYKVTELVIRPIQSPGWSIVTGIRPLLRFDSLIRLWLFVPIQFVYDEFPSGVSCPQERPEDIHLRVELHDTETTTMPLSRSSPLAIFSCFSDCRNTLKLSLSPANL